jgi:hypothetical protein
MRSLVLIAACVLLSGVPAAHAEGPWCGVQQDGGPAWRCEFQTLEQCTQEMVAGARGYCNRNPRWTGSVNERPARRRHVRAAH